MSDKGMEPMDILQLQNGTFKTFSTWEDIVAHIHRTVPPKQVNSHIAIAGAALNTGFSIVARLRAEELKQLAEPK